MADKIRSILSLSRSRIFRDQAICVLLLFVFVNGVLWAVSVPLWQTPDEPSHFGTIAFIAEHRRLPSSKDRFYSDEILLSMQEMQTNMVAFHQENRQTFSDSLEGPGEKVVRSLPASTRTSVEHHANNTAMQQPPLYYLLEAGIYRLFYKADILTRAMAGRIFSVALLTLVVFLSYHIARLAFPNHPAMRLTVPALVGFQPMSTHIGTAINTDVLAILIFTLLLYLGIKIVQDGLSAGRALATGIAFGAAILTKPHTLSVAPVIGLALILRLIWRDKPWRQLIVRIALIPLSTLIACGWWVYGNLSAGGSGFYTTQRQAKGVQLDLTFWQYLEQYRHALLERLHRSYWAQFGWLDTDITPVYYDILIWITILAALGLIIYWISTLIRRISDRQLWPVALLTVGSLGLLGGWAVVGFTFTRQTGYFMPRQGRYFLPAIAANSSLLALGALTLLPRPLKPWGHQILRIGAIAFNLICLWGFVVPRYYW